MYVIKRNGNKESVRFDKITNRLQKLVVFEDVDPIIITQKLSSRIYPGITTTELDTLASQICMAMVMDHPNYGILGARIAISNHQKNTDESFYEVMTELKNNKDIHGNDSPLVNENFYNIVKTYKEEIEKMIDMQRDFLLDFFGFKTLEKSYLLKAGSGKVRKIIERPQHLFMRVAVGIHENDLESVKKLYDNLSLKRYTHATPTLFNAGMIYPQLSSCFLSATEDSVEGIFKTIAECAQISKWSGGIGIHISNIRANGSYIRKTAGRSDGIMPMLKVYNDVSRYINQSGKRNGSFAMYIEPYHADIFTFLDAKKNVGSDEIRARDLFYALWVPDIFMEMVQKEGDWYLMCPDMCPGLPDVYGEDFNRLYYKYVEEGKYIKKIKARDLWKAIISSQVETGVPYIGYKDHVNKKNNQMNIGTIKSSNLCIEINEVSNEEETSVCNLASICLPSILQTPNKENINTDLYNDEEKQNLNYIFNGKLKLFSKEDCIYCKLLKGLLKERKIDYEEIADYAADVLRNKCKQESKTLKPFTTVPQLFSDYEGNIYHFGGYTEVWKLLKPRINHKMLYDLSYELIGNLNKVIDINYYPIEKTRTSNMRHRPVGLGVQGLADVFLQMKLSFDSEDARKINKEIFETMYFGTMNASHDIAITEGPYSTFKGSPLSEGKFQFNLWGINDSELSCRWDWNKLREKVIKNGVRNSLLIALMPTASTSQIMGSYVEAFEPLSSNLYTRRTLAGEFTIINPYLIKDLISLDLWNDDIKTRLQYDKGSVQNIKELPKFLKDVYRTAYEIPQKSVITMSAERAPFVCQSQSLNLFFDKPDFSKLTAAHFLGWKLGLKTGSYYIRSKPALNSQRFGIDITKEQNLKKEDNKNEEQECLSCGA
jgi:ribonucleoside-diphosphate reductase alpha subunit